LAVWLLSDDLTHQATANKSCSPGNQNGIAHCCNL
jgi:hypothetical protein